MITEFNQESIQTFMDEWLAVTIEVAAKHNLVIANPGIKYDTTKLNISLDVMTSGDANSYGKDREYYTAPNGHVCEIIPFPVSK